VPILAISPLNGTFIFIGNIATVYAKYPIFSGISACNGFFALGSGLALAKAAAATVPTIKAFFAYFIVNTKYPLLSDSLIVPNLACLEITIIFPELFYTGNIFG